MKKYLYLCSVILISILTSCNNDGPTSPDEGGTYFVSEVYNLLGMQEQKAIDKLEQKGYEYTGYEYDPEKREVHFFEYESKTEAYRRITMVFEDGVVVDINGFSRQTTNDYKSWNQWLSKQMSYELWLGVIDEKVYFEGDKSYTNYPNKSSFNSNINDFKNMILEYYYNKDKDFTFYIYAEKPESLVCGGMKGGKEYLNPDKAF